MSKTDLLEARRAKLSAKLSKLSASKRAMLKKRIKGEGNKKEKLIPKRSASEPLPLSFTQQRFWFMSQLDPDTIAYLIPAVFELTGPFDGLVFERAINRMIQRHEILRTLFATGEGGPIQIVREQFYMDMRICDFRGLTRRDRQRLVQRMANRENRIPFDLETGPLLRITLLKLADLDHVLLMTMHHIIWDGWSSGLFVRELGLYYNAFSAGKTLDLPALTIQYGDFAAWQQATLQGEILKTQLDFWRRYLAGAPAILELPLDFPRPAQQNFRGAVESVELPVNLSRKILQFSKQLGVTPFMTLLAGYKLMLARYSNQPDISVATVSANRNRAEIEALIGCFVNTLVMRTAMGDNPGFSSLVKRVSKGSVEAYAHQDLPFEKLVNELCPNRTMSYNPLAQVVFVFQNMAVSDEEDPAGLQFEMMKTEGRVALFDLNLTLGEARPGSGKTASEPFFEGYLRYKTDLLKRATVIRFFRHYCCLMEHLLDEPARPVLSVSYMTETERRSILEDWNHTDQPLPAKNLAVLFENQVRAHPDDVAVIGAETELSFRHLNERANRIAHYLREAGIGPDAPVGVCLLQGVELVATLLGIVKAGGAYVPLDPEYPSERLSYLLQDTAMTLLVAETATLECLPAFELTFLNILMVDEDEAELRERPAHNMEDGGGVDQLAYVVYTSGTTGRPKGVQITHRDVIRLVLDRNYLCLEPTDTVAQVSNISFDALTFEVWTPLIQGARLCPVARSLFLDPERYALEVERFGINVMFTTTALFNQLARVVPAIFNTMKYVLFGGEQVDPRAVKLVLEAGGPTDLLHVYGPTESTTFATWQKLTAVAENAVNLPMGSPIGNTRTYVLDHCLNAVGMGIVGELFLSGLGLARGYLNRPDLTANCFIPSPFCGVPGSRLYRTGDLVRRLDCGAIEFAGRRDLQVKVRGFRIELEEIEVALGKHANVAQVVVLARRDEAARAAGASKRLVAYLVPAGDTPSPEDLKAFLATSLPDYMVPDIYVALESFPLNPNGKVDRKKLPEPGEEVQNFSDVYVAPRNPAEAAMAQVWQSVLGVERVGALDNFFELGGDSLLSIQIKARARRHELDFELNHLFENPTVAGLVHAIAEDAPLDAEPLPALESVEPFQLLDPADRKKLPAGLEDAYPISLLQAGLLFHSVFENRAGTYHVILPFLMHLPFDREAVAAAMEQMSLRHEMLRTSFALDGYGEPLQFVHAHAEIPLEVVDLRNLTDETDLLEEEKKRPFDWETAPLIRVVAVRLSEASFRLVFSLHHAIMDGWSNASLVTEFTQRYQALLAGETPELELLAMGYRDYVAAEKEALGDPEGRRFWRDWLAGAPLSRLPRWNPSVEEEESRGERFLPLDLPETVSEGLYRLAKSANVPLKTVLFVAHLKTLSLAHGSLDLVSGLSNNCRLETEGGDQVLGLFLNVLPFRLQIRRGQSWLDLIHQVFELEKAMLPRRRFPLSEIIRESGGEVPFETAFNFVHFHVVNRLQDPDWEQKIEAEEGASDTNFTAMISFGLSPGSDRVQGSLSYRSGLIDPRQATEMARSCGRVLGAMTENPEALHLSTRFLEPETAVVLEALNRTRTEFDRTLSLNRRFERMVVLYPDTTAMVIDEGDWRYAELNARANRLARRLLQMGGLPEEPIGLLLPPSPELIQSILAVLKAGGAYVPLDPDLPRERLRFHLEDTGIRKLICLDPELAAHLPTEVIDPTRPDHEKIDPSNLDLDIHPSRLAYIMFTSGSTGLPKGTAIPHAAVSRLVCNNNLFTPQPGQVMGLTANPIFDPSSAEIWTALVHGAALAVVPKEILLSPMELAPYLERHRIVAIFTTTAILHRYAADHPDIFAGLLSCTFGGEAADPVQVGRILAAKPPGRLVNAYGPTECTAIAVRNIVTQVGADDRSVPIGEPLSNTTVFVVNPAGDLCPLGVPGELLLGGEGLARAYVRRPDLTAERFVPHAFSAEPGARLYRSGDMVRFLPERGLEFLGRRDQQVKLRGFRVELGEIEACLNACEGVGQAVVTVTRGEAGNHRLVAYLVLEDGPDALDEVGRERLRVSLAARLPEYMVPEWLIPMAQIPLTPTGKIDVRAFPQPQQEAVREAVAGPRYAAEEMLVGIWSALLDREQVGVFDNFFDLGGHSLIATRMFSRIFHVFGVSLPLKLLFDAPTIAQLARHIQESARAEGSEALTITRVSRSEDLPLSFAQQRLWFIHQMNPTSSAYNSNSSVRIKGDLDIRTLESCLQRIISRHEILRTCFVEAAGKPTQVISESGLSALEISDMQGLDSRLREQVLHQRAVQEAEQGFDLARSPLYRVLLLRLGSRDHALLLTMHHIISDGWSMGLFIEEVIGFYEAEVTGGSFDPPPDRLQYADFSAWQRRRLSGAELESQLGFWRDRLADAPTLLEMPTDFPRPLRQNYHGAMVPLHLPETLTQRLRTFTRDRGTTLFMTLLTVWQSLLARYSGQNDIVVGTIIANRNHLGVERMLGCFVNTLALRTHFTARPSFAELLAQVSRETLDAYAHQDLPFERLVDDLGLERSLSHNPLVQAMLVLHNIPAQDRVLPGLELASLDLTRDISLFDLNLTFSDNREAHLGVAEGGGLPGFLQYNSDLFQPHSIERLIRHFLRLLDLCLRDPEVPVLEQPILDEEENRRVLYEWNDSEEKLPSFTLPQWVGNQAARTPEQDAMVFPDGRMSYAELERDTNRLANYLISQGVAADSMVGLCLRSGPDMVSAMLAILKAGAAYVPLDPDYPQERLAFMMRDTAMTNLLVHGESMNALPSFELNFLNVLILDEERDLLEAESSHAPSVILYQDQLAYVVYTSGTTGRPKGVQISHRNVIRLISDRSYVALEPGMGIAQISNISFDALTFELWTALAWGGRLCLIPREAFLNPEKFRALLGTLEVQMLFITTALFNQLSRAVPDLFSGCEAVLFGGEQVDPRTVRAVLAAGRPRRLLHVYGPTESTTFSSWYPIETVAAEAVDIPIGKPINHTSLLVLDRHMNPQPLGVVGELFIGGEGLARGYLNRADLTAESFVPNPYRREDSRETRLYRSGDLVRRLETGDIAFVGRVDHQVKVRGFRIELEEIENALVGHNAVESAVVLAVKDEERIASKRLVAFIKNEAESSPAEELREFLAASLPSYMIPAVYLEVKTFPMTPNGKLDRRALLVLLEQGGDRLQTAEKTYVGPRNQTETLMCRTWEQVLGTEQVGIHDNFFELGGDSLLSIQIKAQAREQGLDFDLNLLFENPTVAALSAGLSPGPIVRQEPVIGPFQLLSAADRENLPEGVEAAYPPSHLQLGLLYHSAFETRSGVYQVILPFTLEMTFDRPAMERALAALCGRHSMLRTAFELNRFQQPLQLVYERVEIPLTIEDLGAASDHENFFEQWSEREKRQPFEWNRAPLMRAYVFLLGASHFRLVLSLHHALTDGWSNAALVAELLEIYAAALEGRVLERGAIPTTYRDFVALERATMEEPQAQIFWDALLEDAPRSQLTPSGLDSTENRQAAEPIELTPATAEGLRALAKETGLPLKTVLLTAHIKVMSLVLGAHDLVMGVATDGRPESLGAEQVLGLFLNTVPFRMRLNSGSWMDLAKAVFQLEKAILPHRRFPLSELVRRQNGRLPFQSVFNFTHFHVVQSVEEAGLSPRVTMESGASDVAFDLLVTFSVDPSGGSIQAELGYQTRVVATHQARILSRILARVLAAMAERADAAHDRFNEPSPELKTILAAFNDTASVYDRDLCIPRRFRRAVALHGAATALVYGEERFYYERLDQLSDLWAARLRELGVGLETKVGLVLARSPQLITAMLAVLKAGGAYVPLDTDFPAERLAFMVADAGLSLVLTQTSLAAHCRPWPVAVFSIDETEFGRDMTARSAEFPIVPSQALAYIMYTSGSTGTPKGAAISHANISRLVCASNYLQLNPQDRVAQMANPAFDAATFEIWAPLLHGARVVGVPMDLALTPHRLAEFLRESGMTTMFLTTALLNRLVAEEPGIFTTLETVLFGGEAVDPRAVKRLLEGGRPARLLHVYGPTECTSFASWFTVSRVGEKDATIPIGRPLANTSMFVLSGFGHPVPLGVPGQLWIGGEGLARAYWARPDLTAACFVPDHLGGDPGGRLYRSGDRVILNQDGQIEFLGRADGQVKLRGFRLELGEIEAALLRHDLVREAVVLAREDQPGERQLVAYARLAAETGQVDDEAADPTSVLKLFLRENLADFMVPAHVILLAAFPLTPNGKLDKRALPAPNREVATVFYVAPRNEIEEVLTGIWSSVLKLERVGVQDNFFDLGGHSLLATQVFSQIRALFKLEIPIRTMFERPTIEALAKVVTSSRFSEGREAEPPLVAVDRDGDIPLSFAQQRLWFIDRLEPGNAAYNMNSALTLKGLFDSQAFETAIAETVRRHESLRTRFAEGTDGPIQLIAPFTSYDVPFLDLSALSPEARDNRLHHLAKMEARQPFHLESGPLLRCSLLRRTSSEHLLLISMHHIISDGWSLSVFVGEVVAFYEAAVRGQRCLLPPLPIQYADFAVWQRNRLKDAELERQLNYWRRRLEETPSLLELPTDFPRPRVQRFEGAILPLQLPVELSDRLRRFSREQGVTLFMTLLSGFQVLLGRYAGQSRVVVGSPIANRNRAEIEGLIGFFVNTLVLPTDLSGNPGFRNLVKRVGEETLDAYGHQDLPFERLVEALQPKRSLSHNALFQVMFVLQNMPGHEGGLSGLQIEGLAQEGEISQFDMTLSLSETPRENGQTQLTGFFKYSTALFSRATMEKTAIHFVRLLESLMDLPDKGVYDHDFLSREERAAALAGAQGEIVPLPAYGGIHQWIEAAAAKTPDAQVLTSLNAPTDEGGLHEFTLTYGALAERSDRLAACLNRRGVGPESIVAICMEPSREMMIGLLAVLKAGGAYLPLDPMEARERLATILEDAACRLMLTQTLFRESLQDLPTEPVCLDVDGPQFQGGEDFVPVACRPQRLATLIYTSGSTGKPKGVAVTHGGLINYVTASNRRLEWDGNLRFGLVSTLAADLGNTSIYAALCGGGSLHLIHREMVASPDLLGPYFFGRYIEGLKIVPSHLAALLNTASPAQILPRHTLILGGEACTPQLVQQLRELAPGCRIFNHYGPSESTIGVAALRLDGGEAPIPLGRALANIQLYVWDERGRLQQAGSPGEVMIGGAGLARAYLNLPERTAAAFVPDPHATTSGGRLYRSGDLGRYLADGNLLFLGRLDRQLKLRGFRIEPGEIQSLLRTHERVAEAVVQLRRDASGNQRLVGYLVLTAAASNEPAVEAGEMRRFIGSKLPAHMVPSTFMVLPCLPLTANGKLNFKALPEPETATDEAYTAPQTEVERAVVAIWSELLGIPKIGVNGQFFELGGHSLMMARVISRLREILRVDIPMRVLFEYPVAADLAQYIQVMRKAALSSGQDSEMDEFEEEEII